MPTYFKSRKEVEVMLQLDRRKQLVSWRERICQRYDDRACKGQLCVIIPRTGEPSFAFVCEKHHHAYTYAYELYAILDEKVKPTERR